MPVLGLRVKERLARQTNRLVRRMILRQLRVDDRCRGRRRRIPHRQRPAEHQRSARSHERCRHSPGRRSVVACRRAPGEECQPRPAFFECADQTLRFDVVAFAQLRFKDEHGPVGADVGMAADMDDVIPTEIGTVLPGTVGSEAIPQPFDAAGVFDDKIDAGMVLPCAIENRPLLPFVVEDWLHPFGRCGHEKDTERPVRRIEVGGGARQPADRFDRRAVGEEREAGPVVEDLPRPFGENTFGADQQPHGVACLPHLPDRRVGGEKSPEVGADRFEITSGAPVVPPPPRSQVRKGTAIEGRRLPLDRLPGGGVFPRDEPRGSLVILQSPHSGHAVALSSHLGLTP